MVAGRDVPADVGAPDVGVTWVVDKAGVVDVAGSGDEDVAGGKVVEAGVEAGAVAGAASGPPLMTQNCVKWLTSATIVCAARYVARSGIAGKVTHAEVEVS